MSTVLVTGYERRLSVIALVKLIQRLTGDTLAPSKNRVEALLKGHPFELSFANDATADEFSRAARDIGALVQFKPVTVPR
jgi:hypothetical protein